jgi:hypothetical protein
MNPVRWKSRGVLFAVAGALALGLSACLGGTGTDTENGLKPVLVTARVLTQDSTPAAGVSFTVHQAYSRADSLLESPLVGGDTTHLVTDGGGYVTFTVKQEGDYVAQGASGDSILFLDTLKTRIKRDPGGAVGGGLGSPLFRVEKPVHAKGKLRLTSSGVPDSGRVYLQGTRLVWNLEAGGKYDLGWLPPSAEKLKVRVVYWSKDTSSCVKPGNSGTNSATLSLTDSVIVIDDLVKGNGCPQVLP